jgi:hypothetical protein
MNKKIQTLFVAASLSTSLFIQSVSAQEIFTFNFQSKNDTVTTESTSGSFGTLVDSNVQDVTISLGAGMGGVAYSNAFGGSPQGTAQTTLADAILNDVYHTFTVTPVSGQQITYASLDFNFTVQNGGELEVYSSFDGFGTALYSNNAIGGGGAGTSDTIDLSGLGIVSGPIEFRFYSSSSGNYDQRGIGLAFTAGGTGNDLVLKGTTSAVPEPSTYAALTGLLALSCVYVRRRR